MSGYSTENALPEEAYQPRRASRGRLLPGVDLRQAQKEDETEAQVGSFPWEEYVLLRWQTHHGKKGIYLLITTDVGNCSIDK